MSPKVAKVLKWGAAGLGVIALLAGAFVVKNIVTWRPMFPNYPMPQGFTASQDPQVIAAGKYIVANVAHCGACHSTPTEYSAYKPGDDPSLAGGHQWHMGPLATVNSVNITPDEATGIGTYTDAELARAIRHGVAKDGRGLLYMMGVGPMSDEDLTAVISYLRAIDPVDRPTAETEVRVMGQILFQGPMSFFATPHDYSDIAPAYVPPGAASLDRGTYLAEGPAWCVSCHSNYEFNDGNVRWIGTAAAGGQNATFPDETDDAFEFAAPNLSKAGHVKDWTKEQFIQRMRDGRVYAGSPMPWESYAGMTDEDLDSLWMWMQSIPPTKREVGPPRREAGWKG